MVLGIYYLTKDDPAGETRKPKDFGSIDEVVVALENKAIDYHQKILLRHRGRG